MSDTINRQAAIDALWKALYEYEDKTEKQFQESEDLDIGDWIEHRIFVQNMSDIDRQTILNLPSAQPERIKGHWVEIASSNHTYKCSVCGRLLVNITDGKNNVAKNYPYCHCGADMRGEQDE